MLKNFKFDLPSLLIPTAIHFFSLQYWHLLRLIRNMEHCWFFVHGLYWIFCWMLRRKNPCKISKFTSSVTSHVHFSGASPASGAFSTPSVRPSHVGDIFSRSSPSDDEFSQFPPAPLNSALIHPIIPEVSL